MTTCSPLRSLVWQQELATIIHGTDYTIEEAPSEINGTLTSLRWRTDTFEVQLLAARRAQQHSSHQTHEW
jgi:hypothetical protein